MDLDSIISAATIALGLFGIFLTSIWRQERRRVKRFPQRMQEMEEARAKRAKERGELATRFEEALRKLRDSSIEAQRLMSEIELHVRSQTDSVTFAERRLKELANEEASLQERLDRLQRVEPEATREMAELVGDLLEKGGKRDRRRDYMLFFAGVLASGVLSLVITLAAS